MWNHPFYLDLYQSIMEPTPPPEIEGSLQSLRAINPDVRYMELLEAATEASRAASALGGAEAAALLDDGAARTPLFEPAQNFSARDFIGKKKGGAARSLASKLMDSLLEERGAGAEGLIAAPTSTSPDGEIQRAFDEDGSAPLAMEENAPSKEDWIQLLRAFGAHGRAQDAIRAAERAEKDFGVSRDEEIYATLIVACGDAKQTELAESIFDEMRFNGAVPTENAWSALVHAQAQTGHLDTAFMLMDRMTRDGVKPSLAAYTALLAGLYHHAPRNQLFDQANEVWFTLKYSGAVPSLSSYTEMVRCCAKGREIERAFGFIEEMR
jgi:pentatricopeptide repeat protein